MKNEIHKKCKEILIKKLVEGLGDISGSNYKLDFFAYWTIKNLELEKILSNINKKELQEYIREDALTLYVYDSLIDEIIENPLFNEKNESEESYKISDVTEIPTLADKIINSLDNIPLKLDFAFNLGNQFTEHITNGLQLSNELLLVNDISWLNDTFKLINPNEKKNELIKKSYHPLTVPISPKWKDGNTYLLINLNGFVSNTGKTNTSFNIENTFKSFLGLMIANNILNFSYNNKRNFDSQYYVFTNNIISSKTRLNGEFIKGIDRLSANTGLIERLDHKKFMQTLELAAKLFQDNEECEKIRNACCWTFDSYCSENELLAFVQATITLEILLGDKSESDKVGLGSLLKNRCAYLLGKTNEERNEILKEFNEIYDIRSRIVHRGHPKLNSNEKNLLQKVRSLAKRVIVKELELL